MIARICPPSRVVVYDDRRGPTTSAPSCSRGDGQGPAAVLGGRCSDGEPQAIAVGRDRRCARHPPERVARAVSVVGSMAVIESSNSFATHRDPAAAPSEFGPSPTETVASTRPVEGSSRETVPSKWFATQIDSNADEHGRRSAAHALRERHAQVRRVDARDAGRSERDPHPVRREGHLRGLAREPNGLGLAR